MTAPQYLPAMSKTTNNHPFALFLNFLASYGKPPAPFAALDIETIAHAEARFVLGEPPEQLVGEEALHPSWAKIAAVQLMDAFGNFCLLEGSEAEILSGLWEVLDAKPTLITWNGMGFDLPMLETRCRLLAWNSPGVPEWFAAKDKWGRRDIGHLDLCEAIRVGRSAMKMHHAALLMGLPGKPAEIGDRVSEMLADERTRTEALAYVESDVVTPIQIAYLTGLLHDRLGLGAEIWLLPPARVTGIQRPVLPEWQREFLSCLPQALSLRSQLEARHKGALAKFPQATSRFLDTLSRGGGLPVIFSRPFLNFAATADGSEHNLAA